MNNEYKIKCCWVARDYDGTLMLYDIKPHRCVTGVWVGGENYFPLGKNMFPDLDTRNEPIEVELTIKDIKKG